MDIAKLAKQVPPRTLDMLGPGRFFYYRGEDTQGAWHPHLLCMVAGERPCSMECVVLDPRYKGTERFSPGKLTTVFPLCNDCDLPQGVEDE